MGKNMKRAPMMMAIAATLALGALAAPAQAQTEIKIGFINSYSGFLAQPGDQMDKGVMLYKQLHDKDLPPGVTVTLLKRDDTSTPEVAKRLAQELITRDHVQLLFGVIASPNAAAIAPLTAEAKIPLVITNAAGTSITAHLALRRARFLYAVAYRTADGAMGGEARLEDRLHRGQRFHSRP